MFYAKQKKTTKQHFLYLNNLGLDMYLIMQQIFIPISLFRICETDTRPSISVLLLGEFSEVTDSFLWCSLPQTVKPEKKTWWDQKLFMMFNKNPIKLWLNKTIPCESSRWHSQSHPWGCARILWQRTWRGAEGLIPALDDGIQEPGHTFYRNKQQNI